MIRHYWALEGKPQKQKIISREYGYHGSTMVSASMGGMSGMHDQACRLPDFEHIKAAIWISLSGEYGRRHIC
jgi:putrescine aminotransferase